MTTIWLIRHAEAEGNLCRRIHGHFDTNITSNGMRQIEDLYRRFQDIPVDVCYSSDLTRTMTTAQAVYLSKGLPLYTDAAFREVNLGVWEDTPFGYLNEFDSEQMGKFNRDAENWRVEGAETFEQYTRRFLQGLAKLEQQYRNKSIAIVSHGAVIRGALLTLFPGLDVGHSDNTAVTKLTAVDGTYSLEFLNDNSHLRDGASTFAKQSWWKDNAPREDDALWFQTAGEQHAFVAYRGQTPVGRVCWHCVDDKCGEIDCLELLPQYQGKGLAVQLLGQAMFTMRHAGVEKMLVASSKEWEAVINTMKKLGAVERRAHSYSLSLSVAVLPMEEICTVGGAHS